METIQDFSLENQTSPISKLVEKAREAETQTVNLMEPGSKIKRGRGRPPKTDTTPKDLSPKNPPKQAPDQIQTREIVLPLVKLTSKAAGAYVGDKRAEMNHEELEAAARALGLVADKWMPLMGQQYGPEVLLLTTLGAYGMRVVALKAVLEEEKKAINTFKPDLSKKPSDSLAFPTEPKPMASEPYLAQNLSL